MSNDIDGRPVAAFAFSLQDRQALFTLYTMFSKRYLPTYLGRALPICLSWIGWYCHSLPDDQGRSILKGPMVLCS